jgi:hypothetical protein
MPTYTFTDHEAKVYEMVADGDYILEVVDADISISKGDATKGSEQLELKVQVQGRPGATFRETLIFHESVTWKIDLFLKSTGWGAKKGEEVELTPENVIGLRGWATVFVDTYKEKKKNKVRVWLTDKPKIPRVTYDAPEPEQNNSDPFA